MTKETILLSRQPVYDQKLNVTAYELLFHPPEGVNGADWDSDQETSAVLVNAFTEVGIGQVADHKTAFIHFTRRWLLSPPPLEPQFVTIQVMKSTNPDAAIVAAVRKLREQGFSIALECASGINEWDALLKLAHVVMVDVAAVKGDMLEKLVDYLKKFPVRLLAQKVENYTVFEHCAKLGFDIFQGGFLCRPQSVKGNAVATNKLVVMNLLAALQNPDIDIKKLEGIITNDVALSVKLLRVCNSASYASQAKIDSIKRAIMILGLQKLKSWVSVIALSRMSDKPTELVMLTLTRAKMMEMLAQKGGLSAEKCFTVGLFSAIDAFFDNDINAVLETLPFDDEIKRAIAQHDGTIGHLLKYSLAHERGDWGSVDWDALGAIKIDRASFENAYIESVRWSSTVMQSLLT
jgi:EAL and modified HD-GYP domain-containing signal transduction protein